MMSLFRSPSLLCAILAAGLVAACGGGSDDNHPAAAAQPLPIEPNAPQITGDIATDGLNWFNFRRQQVGLSALARDATVDVAARGHSRYQQRNDTITHTQIVGKPGFTGTTLFDRLNAAGYLFTQDSYAYGEVLSSTFNTTGMEAAEDLIGAIYHRFLIFEPMFQTAGAGAATVPGGATYFTCDFTADGLTRGLGNGNFVVYPFDNQQSVPTVFYSDLESPDPVPGRNAVGYPISMHADLTKHVVVQTFTLETQQGTTLPVTLLSAANDVQTSSSGAAIIPVAVLAPHTTYTVRFVGFIDQAPVSRSWSFTTR